MAVQINMNDKTDQYHFKGSLRSKNYEIFIVVHETFRVNYEMAVTKTDILAAIFQEGSTA